jgi:hypothetical protein
MATRRVYAWWLPPNPRERLVLLKLKRQQRLAAAWLMALIPAGWLLVLLTPTELVFAPFTIIWIGIGLWLAHRISATRCPRCGAGFAARRELPYLYVLFNQRCENCGLGLAAAKSLRQ